MIVHEILKWVADYPNGTDRHAMVDQSIVDECAELLRREEKEPITSAKIKSILDKCVNGALCADIVITSLDIAYNELVKNE